MRSRRLWFVFAIVLIPAAIWGQTLLGGQPQAATSPNGGRPTTASSGEQQAVYVINPLQDIKDEALANMRHHMEGLEAILAGLADGDLAKISQAAADNGQSYMAEHGDMGMWAMSHGYPWMNF
jgi:hypothetical protein